MNIEDCETGALQIIGAPPTVARRRAVLEPSTVLARIMTALDHASPWEQAQVYDVLNARGFDEEPSAGDILQVCDVLELPAAVLLGTPRDDLRGLDDVAGGYADR